MFRILATTFAALLGFAFGSFLNVCLSRWPEGESIVRPRSHCRSCTRPLLWFENIPLLSWLVLGGRCRTCDSEIHWRYPLIEAGVGLLWAVCAWTFFPSLPEAGISVSFSPAYFLEHVALLPLTWLLVALAALDAENLWLPDFLTVPGILAGLVFSSLVEQITSHGDTSPRPFRVLLGRVLAALCAAALILLIRFVYWLFRRQEGVGLGDAKLMAMLAAWLGLPGALLSFFFGVILGALVAIPLVLGKSSAQSKLPLGTFLCIGGIVTALWGRQILETYLTWSGF